MGHRWCGTPHETYAFLCYCVENENQVLMARKEYVSMYSKVAADAEKSKNSSKKRLSPLTAQEQRRFDELEEELPLQAMVMFRTMAKKEVRFVWVPCCLVAVLPALRPRDFLKLLLLVVRFHAFAKPSPTIPAHRNVAFELGQRHQRGFTREVVYYSLSSLLSLSVSLSPCVFLFVSFSVNHDIASAQASGGKGEVRAERGRPGGQEEWGRGVVGKHLWWRQGGGAGRGRCGH